MKMNKTLYGRLYEAMEKSPVIVKYGIVKLEETYVKDHAAGSLEAHDIHKRLRWDIWHTIPFEVRHPLLNDIYDAFMHDTHIDTALKKVIKDLKLAA